MIESQQQQIAAQQRQMDSQRAQMVVQHEQTVLLRDGLVTVHVMASAAQQTAAAAIDRATTPREPRTGNITDFMRLNLRVFTGNKDPLEAEQ